MKKLLLFLLCVVSLLQAKSFTFFLFVPEYREWLETPPIIRNLANADTMSMNVDEVYFGWFSYTWDENSIPDSVLIFAHRDSSYKDPIDINGFCFRTNLPIMMKLLKDASERDSVFFVSDFSIRETLDNVEKSGFAYQDIRQEIYYTKKDPLDYYSKKLFVLVPDYKEWIHEIPIVADASNLSRTWEMSPDELYDGWFNYTWNFCSETPDSLYLYKKTDSQKSLPVGINGFAYGETELLALNVEIGREIYFYPDLNYDCEISGNDCFCKNGAECFCNVQEHSTWQYYDVRSKCQLRYDCLKDDFEPTYYENVNKFAFMYTVSSSEGILIQADKKMTSDSKDVVYLYNQTIRINAEPLSDGDYVVEFWPIAIENAQKRILRFSVKNGVASKGPSFVKRPYIGIQTFGSSIQISSSEAQPYVVFSSMGQAIIRGSVVGSVNVKMPSAGFYIVKVGAGMRRIKVFE